MWRLPHFIMVDKIPVRLHLMSEFMAMKSLKAIFLLLRAWKTKPMIALDYQPKGRNFCVRGSPTLVGWGGVWGGVKLPHVLCHTEIEKGAFGFRFSIHQVLQEEKRLESGKHKNISKLQHWHTSRSIVRGIHPSTPPTLSMCSSPTYPR